MVAMSRSTAHDPGRAPPRPVDDAYWVLRGRLLVGAHPGSRSRALAMERLRRLLESGVTCFIDLTEPAETAAYETLLPFQTPTGRRVEYLREPIVDHGVPDGRETMARILAMLDGALESGHVVYLHCRAGIGRSAMAAGCWLAERSGSGARALGELAELWPQAVQSQYWPRVPETEEQVQYVRDWVALRATHGAAAAGQRLRGAWYGLALGDALATAPGDGGAGAPLAVSQHTAMTLCLAESLLACGRFDARDQIERYLEWQRTARPAGGDEPTSADVARALAAYRWRGQPMAGSHDPRDAAPTSLPRVLAAAAFAPHDPAAAIALAAECSRTTHQSPVVLDGCRLYAASLLQLLRDEAGPGWHAGLPDFEPSPWSAKPLRHDVQAVVTGSGGGPAAQPGGVLHAVLESRRIAHAATGFEAALVAADEAGGANARLYRALVGTLYGAHQGFDALPDAACARLAEATRLDDVIGQMLARTGAPESGA